MKVFIILTIFFLMQISPSIADDSLNFKDKSEGKLNKEDRYNKILTDRLRRIRDQIAQLQSQIKSHEEKYEAETDSSLKAKIEQDIEKLKDRYLSLRFSFIETITNINLDDKPSETAKTELTDDIKQIIDPIIIGFKKISKKPREIQYLREKIDFYQSKIQGAHSAIESLEDFIKQTDDEPIKVSSIRSKSIIEEVIKDFEIKLEDTQFKLLKLEKGDKGFIGNVSTFVFDFIKTKGKNLFLAFTGLVFIIWFLSLFKERITSFILNRIISLANLPMQTLWLKRPLSVIYSLLAFFLAFFVSVSILYVLNDWILVTIILISVVAILWSSKQYLPQYVEQFKLILNLGSVKEGERIVYNNLPWKVKALGFYCRLVNPALSGGDVRVSSKDLIGHCSRPVGDSEPWFPTRNGDWVLLSDSTYGKVMMQTPEMIQVKFIGDDLKYISTLDFLSLTPINLSQGFSLNFEFGVDYSHQKILFSDLIPKLQNFVKECLYTDYLDDKSLLREFSIAFKNAAESSLDLRIFLRCDGKLAPKRNMLLRSLQTYMVMACNKYDYIIPFNQLSVHMQK